jgi:predicted helicase
MSKDDILKMLRSKSIKQAGNLSDKEIFGILDGRFIAPKFDTKFFKELQRDFPEMEKRTPYIATKFADLFDLYNDRSLLTELPEINIKGD